ncbi:acyl-CoA N-acyltransferase [Mycena vulgaris]|nr:acyl-CoA N-acyltransferase [Mycena vulgaris]
MPRIIETKVVFAQGDQEIIADCHRIRKDVFHIEQKFPLDTEFDDVEDIATHFLRRTPPTRKSASSNPVGTIRGTVPGVYPGISRYKLSRLAVDKEYRTHKFGRLLVESLHKWVAADSKASNRPAEIECHSQIPVMGFYAKFGYTPEGDRFDEDGEPHQNMVLRFP